MTDHESSRTLVKSTPELWAECSDAAALARHLGSVGEIRITRLEPETTVAWEGAAARGTVELEPAGWGTRVTLTITQSAESQTAQIPATAGAQLPVEEPAAEADEPATDPRPGWFARLRGRLRGPTPSRSPGPGAPAEATAEAPAEAPAEVSTEASPPGDDSGDWILRAALDSLGRAHHRPYSRG
jgi:hypothetical protein